MPVSNQPSEEHKLTGFYCVGINFYLNTQKMSVKLYYFDTRGYAEPIRQILSYGGIDFEDIRIPYTSFPPVIPPEIKSKCRFGQVPMAEFEGKSLTQSVAVTRYFANKVGLVPKDPYEAALCDEYVDAVRDVMSAMTTAYFTKDEAEKKKKMDETIATVRTKYFAVFESILKKNGGKHLVGNSLTWADIYLACVLDNYKIILDVDFTSGFPLLKELKENVMGQPKIKTWIEKRPKTQF